MTGKMKIIDPLEGIVSRLPDMGLKADKPIYYLEIMDIGRTRFLVQGPIKKREAIRRLRKRVKERRPARIYHFGITREGGNMKMPDSAYDWEIKDDLTAMVDPYKLNKLEQADVPKCSECGGDDVHKIYDPSQTEDVYECKKCFNIMEIPEDTHEYNRQGSCKYCGIARLMVKDKAVAHMENGEVVPGDPTLYICTGEIDDEGEN